MKLNNNLLDKSFIKTTVTTSDSDSYSCTYVNNELNKKQDKPIELWTNSSPSSDFTPNEITLSSSDYNYYEVYFRYYKSQTILISEKSIKGYGVGCFIGDTYANQSGGQSKRRRLDYVNNTKLSVGDCKIQNGNSESTSNDFLIPYKIIGYK